MNLEIRRNIYEPNGKEVTPAESKDKVGATGANGEGAAAGTPAAAANGISTVAETKSFEESLKEQAKIYHCYSCGIDCTRVRYHNAQSAPHSAQGKAAASVKYDLCPKCYLEGRFPVNTGSNNYTKLENSKHSIIPDRDAPWTDTETLLLLEGLEMFDDDWASIADHVGTRSRDECILKFLQLEIEDEYLERGDGEGGDGTAAGLSAMSSVLTNNGRVPFTRADNPVMSVVSFLAGLADPTVTAAAAGRAVDEMKRSLRERIERAPSAGVAADKDKGKAPADAPAAEGPAATSGGDDADQPAPSTEVKSEDTMDIDATPAATTTTTTLATRPAPSAAPAGNSAATTTLALAAARASALSSHEERLITRLTHSAVNLQLQKLEVKLSQFGELERLLSLERRDLERRRQQLFLDRLAFRNRVRGVEDALRRAERGIHTAKAAASAPPAADSAKLPGPASPSDGAVKPPVASPPAAQQQAGAANAATLAATEEAVRAVAEALRAFGLAGSVGGQVSAVGARAGSDVAPLSADGEGAGFTAFEI